MGYDIQLFRKEVKEKQLASQAEDFFENEENIASFTEEQKDKLKNRLLKYGYFIENEGTEDISFGFKKNKGISALLTSKALYFSSTSSGIFEISMTASEFTDTNEFVKYDPQDSGWEEV
jgi:hypothetical protein